MTSHRILTITILILCLGYGPREQTLTLNEIPAFPAGWRHVVMPGDTANGYFISSEHQYRIYYDIGDLAGEYADGEAHPNYQWIRRATLDGSSFHYLLDEDDTLYITFPDEGPANYWCKVKDEDQIEYVLELLARYRHELLATGRADPPGTSTGMHSST